MPPVKKYKQTSIMAFLKKPSQSLPSQSSQQPAEPEKAVKEESSVSVANSPAPASP